MANSTREELRVLVRLNHQDRTDLDSKIDAAINVACGEISQLHRWRELAKRDATAKTPANTGSTADGAPVTTTITVDDAIFDSTMVGRTVTFGATSNAYAIASVTSSTVVVVATDASGEADGDAVTISVDQSLTLPSTVDELLLVQLEDTTSSWNVPLWSKDEAERRYPLADMQPEAKPAGCYREEGELFFVPLPDTQYTCRLSFRAKLTLTAGDAAEISVEGFDALVVAHATAGVFEAEEHAESGARWWAIYAERARQKWTSQQSTGVERRADTRLPARRSGGWRDPRLALPEV